MRTWSRVVVTVVVALVTLVILFPLSGTLDQPQRHESFFGTSVPTDNPLLAVGTAAVVAAVAWSVTGVNKRRH